MSEDWTSVAADVAAGIAEAGMAGTIRRTITTGGDPWTPGSGTTTVTNAACTLVIVEYTLRERESTLIGASDKKVLVSIPVTLPAYADDPASLNAPTAADQVIIQGRAHAIVRVMPVSPAGVPVLWEMQVTM